MFCPNCGTKTSSEQKFCRACGLGLEKVALTLAEQLPAKVDLPLQEQKARFEKLGTIALSAFGLGLASLLLYVIGNKLIISQGKVIAGLAMLGLVIMLACGLTSVILFAKANELGQGAKKGRSEPGELNQSESTKELLTEGHFEPVPTVTDRTTELLSVNKGDATNL